MKKRSFLSPGSISFRILAFNILLVFLPIVSLLILDFYEKQLLRYLEHVLVQQARFLAASLQDSRELREESLRILTNLRQRHEARIRVVDSEGDLLADSSIIEGLNRESGTASVKFTEPVEESILYRLATLPFRLYRDIFGPPRPPAAEAAFYLEHDYLEGEEIREALSGRYGAATRISTGGQRSVTLYSAIPVFSGDSVSGVVLASQSTYRILQDLYVRRNEIIKVFLYSIGVAVVISILVSMTITIPLRKLSTQAAGMLDRSGKFRGTFSYTLKKDEIGDLSRSLTVLRHRLEEHIAFIESFASDVSHEFKNPLASIRSAMDVASESEDREEIQRFMGIVVQETARMERLLRGVREITWIDADAGYDRSEPFDLTELIRTFTETRRNQAKKHHVELSLDLPEKPVILNISPVLTVQVLENLVENAFSFTPPGGRIGISLFRENGKVHIGVEDSGSGIPEDIRGNIFNRFFCFRPEEEKKHHSGLGLSIVKAIVEKYNGTITVESSGRGTRFSIELPLLKFKK